MTTVKERLITFKNSLITAKNNLASAITAKGVAASGSNTFADFATKIGSIQSSSENYRLYVFCYGLNPSAASNASSLDIYNISLPDAIGTDWQFVTAFAKLRWFNSASDSASYTDSSYGAITAGGYNITRNFVSNKFITTISDFSTPANVGNIYDVYGASMQGSTTASGFFVRFANTKRYIERVQLMPVSTTYDFVKTSSNFQLWVYFALPK